jgi:antitoxin MazE
MTKKLVKHGNSLALVIDKPVLELLNITADTPLTISTDGRRLVIAAEAELNHARRLDDAIHFTLEHYDQALRQLAK